MNTGQSAIPNRNPQLINGQSAIPKSAILTQQSSDFDQIIVESRAGADVGYRLRNGLVDVCPSRAELVPPYRQRNGNTRLHPIGNSGRQSALTAIVPDSHSVAVVDAPTRSVLVVQLNERFA